PDRGIGGRAGEQRVGDVIGFAEPERQSERDRLADAGDDLVGHALRICECDRSARAARHTDPFTPRTRSAPLPLVGRGWGWGSLLWREVRASQRPPPRRSAAKLAQAAQACLRAPTLPTRGRVRTEFAARAHSISPECAPELCSTASCQAVPARIGP